MHEIIKALTSKSKETSVGEGLKETAIKESPLQNSIESIENSSLEGVKAQNELITEKINAEKIEQIEKNREAGVNREDLAHKELQKEFPELGRRYWGKHIWGIGYGAWSAGNITDALIQEYLEHHKDRPNEDAENFMFE